MHIVESPPNGDISVWQYEEDFEDGYFHSLDYLREKVGQIICARLVIHRYSNGNGRHDHEFAGHYALELTELKSTRGGNTGIKLSLPTEAVSSPQENIFDYYFVTEEGLLVKRMPKWEYEEGYFPVNTDNWDEAFTKLTANSPPIAPLVLA